MNIIGLSPKLHFIEKVAGMSGFWTQTEMQVRISLVEVLIDTDSGLCAHKCILGIMLRYFKR